MSSSDTSSKGRGDILDSISSIHLENKLLIREGINPSPTKILLFKILTDVGEGFMPSRPAAPIIFILCGCRAPNDN